jgi:hypothetical protein
MFGTDLVVRALLPLLRLNPPLLLPILHLLLLLLLELVVVDTLEVERDHHLLLKRVHPDHSLPPTLWPLESTVVDGESPLPRKNILADVDALDNPLPPRALLVSTSSILPYVNVLTPA